MKTLIMLSAIALLSIGVCACGASSEGARSSSPTSAGRSAGVGETAQSDFKGDEDDDDEAREDTGNTTDDNDADFDNDKLKQRGYEDRDDASVLAYGHAAGAAEEWTLAGLVRRYLAAAVAADGRHACAMIVSKRAKSIGEDYGQSTEEPYLRGARTCAVVMSRIFKHFHKQLGTPATVTAVRIGAGEALVVLGSKLQPAGYMTLEREGSLWKIQGLLEQPLP